MSNQAIAYRYPGVKPFETSEKDLFFGRDRDIKDLYDLIHLEKLIVLFGKSGYGKSSLLNAGIIPLLLEHNRSESFAYQPIWVRFGTYVEPNTSEYSPKSAYNRAETPLGILVRRLEQEILLDAKTDKQTEFLTSMIENKSLWYEFKRRQKIDKPRRYVLIFDQFEEFFSYPVAERKAFKEEMAELLYESMPKRVKPFISLLDPKSRLLLAEPLHIKVVFSIRADRISMLDTLKDVFPTILHQRYQLKGLNVEQAREAIEKPARIKDARFKTAPFTYSPEALDKIIEELNTRSGNTSVTDEHRDYYGVEAFQLQIICEHLESAVRNGSITDTDSEGRSVILEHHLPGMANLYESYYRRKLEELDPHTRQAAQLVLEEGLLAEDPATGEGRRMSMDSRALVAQFGHIGVNETLLKSLSDTFLIRPEVNTVGGVSYEISHDTLVAPVLKAKTARRMEEERITALRRQEAAEAQANEERAKRLEAERQRKRARLLAGLAIVGLVFALISMAWAFSAQRTAQERLEQLQQETEKRSVLEMAGRISALEKDCQQAMGQLSGGQSCVSEDLFNRIQQAAKEIKDAQVKPYIENLNQSILQNNPDCPQITTTQ
jgi:energy-coupling factor transporter ATP-binding protein EcfA2